MTGGTTPLPDTLVSTDWLADHLDAPDLRVFDCSTILSFEDAGDRPYRVVSCLAEHEAGHVRAPASLICIMRLWTASRRIRACVTASLICASF